MLPKLAFVALLCGACAERALDGPEGDPGLLDLSRKDSSSPDLATIDLAKADLTKIPSCPQDRGGGLCGASLKVVSVKAQPGCIFIEHVTTAVGQLVFPCAGGAATATFGPDTFTGTVTGNEVHLMITVPFDWSDGCHWSTSQTIDGSVCGDLAFAYSEGPLPGQSGCTSSCVETATLLGE